MKGRGEKVHAKSPVTHRRATLCLSPPKQDFQMNTFLVRLADMCGMYIFSDYTPYRLKHASMMQI